MRIVRRILDVVLGTLGLIAILVVGFIGVVLVVYWVGDRVKSTPPLTTHQPITSTGTSR